MQTARLIQTLIETTKRHSQRAERLKNLGEGKLQWRATAQSWNCLECLEHLNLYGDFYLPKIREAIKKSKSSSELEFKSGWMGSYFAKSMLPKGKLNTMNKFKEKNPLNWDLDLAVIDRFVDQQAEQLKLLSLSNHISLAKVWVPTSLSPLLKLKLGDVFQFTINHNERHMRQIERIQEAMKGR